MRFCGVGAGAIGGLMAARLSGSRHVHSAPASMTVRTVVDGRERQNYPVSDMIFSPAELVRRISQDMTLYSGDVIACGTSVGALPMRPGNVVEVTIDGIGTLSNTYGTRD